MPGWRATVGGVLAAGAVFSLVSCSSGDSGDGPEPLAALVGEDGKFDCRRMYTHVPLQAYLSADLSPVDTRFSMGGAMPVDGAPGQINCPLRYTGPETGGGIAPVYLRSMPEAEDFPWKTDPVRYGDWVTGTATLGDSPIFLAIFESAEHGELMLVSDMDDWKSDPFANLGDRSPDAVRTVIDGLERDAGAAVAEVDGSVGDLSLFTENGRFDCSQVYRRLSLVTAPDVGINLPVKNDRNQIIRDGDDSRSCVVPVGEEETESSVTTGLLEGPSLAVTTGPKDSLRGGPVAGSADLPGWEEYWDFDGADDPVDKDAEGLPSYNARYCRSDGDCITVTSYESEGLQTGRSPQARKNAALPLVRIVTEHEGLATDGEEQ